jgi:hypothetical protein
MEVSMRIRTGLFAWLSVWLLVAGLSSATFGQGSRERTQFGHDVVVGAGEEVSEITCFGGSVRVRGHVAGDVVAFGGNVVIEEEGSVGGDATVFGGGVRLEKTARVGGDVTIFGGILRRDPESQVGGDITNFSGGFWLPLMVALPLIFIGAIVVLIIWLIRRYSRSGVPAPA